MISTDMRALLIVLVTLAGCSSSQTKQDARDSTDTASPAEAAAQYVSPNRSRVVLTVLRILPDRTGTGPCSHVPCRALVRLDSIVAYGSSFPPVLNTGQQLHARFVFTTDSSAHWFPAMREHYPGVKPGTRLRSDIELAGSVDEPGTSSSLVIYGYTVER